ncbi:MAG: hypothetical protein P1T08_10540 [Acidimicrobiia bacterium]|nr:hypothetical protein [Acidimicrobiia bacterium]
MELSAVDQLVCYSTTAGQLEASMATLNGRGCEPLGAWLGYILR